MLFFGLVGIFTLAMLAAMRLLTGPDADLRISMRTGLAIALLFAGLDHLITPERYLAMMPDFVPFPAETVMLTGLCEIAASVGLIFPGLAKLTGLMLALYFICVFPANIKNAVEGLNVDGLPSAGWYYWMRLFFQPVIIWWSLYSTLWINWPFALRPVDSLESSAKET